MVLEIKNLNKIYKNNFCALKNINLSIKSGEKVALLGLNGAGKSTLVGILSGYVTKSSGTVKINGFDIEKDRINATKSMGVVHQEIIYDTFFTVKETLKLHSGYYGIDNNDAEINEILKALDLSDKADTNTRFLSGGMKRRMMIAKALITKPKFLILDEPTVGVDVNQRLCIWNYLDYINKKYNIAILLTTHYMYEAELLCDRVVVINNGEIVIEGGKDEIINQYKMKHIIFELKYGSEDISDVQEKIKSDLLQVNIDNLNFVFNYANIYINCEFDLSEIKVIFEKYNIKVVDIKVNDADLEVVFTKIVNTNKATY